MQSQFKYSFIKLFAVLVVMTAFFSLTPKVHAYAPNEIGRVVTATGQGIPCVWVKLTDSSSNVYYTQTGGAPCNATAPIDINVPGYATVLAGQPLPDGVYFYPISDFAGTGGAYMSTLYDKPVDTNLDGKNDDVQINTFAWGWGCDRNPLTVSVVNPAGWPNNWSGTPQSFDVINASGSNIISDIVYNGGLNTPMAISGSGVLVNPPNPTCSYFGSLNPNDVCDWYMAKYLPGLTQLGYASPTKNDITVVNKGPVSYEPQTQTFTLRDNTSLIGSMTAPTQTIAPGGVVSVSASAVAAANGKTLVDGKFYTFTATSTFTDTTGTYQSSSSGGNTFIYDSSAPAVSFTNFPACPAALPNPLLINATDAGSGVQSVYIKVDGVETNITANNNPVGSNTYTFDTTPFSSGSHTYALRAVDKVGNDSNYSPTQTYDPTSCAVPTPTPVAPWIQTENGDVHSNQGLNVHGGPP
jgi:hypothetical protein